MIHVTDTGIGMTKDHLTVNLDTIAKSGTFEFLEKMWERDDDGCRLLLLFPRLRSRRRHSKHNEDEQMKEEAGHYLQGATV